ncbi:undecaprenyl-diphosphate phosphatase [Marivita sp.]|uniref:undecaprenyl-diphosphate phosphatase n=1 Tax=Marivita sp. TaxID=2003365 RepID=UPI0025BC27BB|nr:undecaprenyl-diphosphate phosphatase [Marivita sp.]
MALTHLLILALIQGVTEFLPISSSGHLILLPNLTGLTDQGLVLDVAVHVGTLVAVILYFWSDVKLVTFGLGRLAKGRVDTQGAFWALCLIVATIPVVALGLVLKLSGLSDLLRSTAVIGWMMLVFGVVLYWADQTGPTVKRATNWSLRDAVIMGLWQALALVPGTSRSGITITAGRHLGYDRESAARLAMLMSIPTILASGALLSVEVARVTDMAIVKDAAIAALFAFLAALAALKLMFKLLKSVSFTPYVIYRIVVGVVLLAIAYT